MTPELQVKMAVWKAKALNGTLTTEEMREAIVALRSGRISAASTAAKKPSTKGPAKSADSLLDELEKL